MPEKLIQDTIAARRAGQIIDPCLSTGFAKYPVTTPYGIKGDTWAIGHHTGEDHACPVGSLAIATSWGTVIHAGPGAGNYGAPYGLLVVIRTRSGRWDYMLCHLSALRTCRGAKVRPGQVVGLTGETGHVTAPHLHFEARPAFGRYGSDVDPINVKRRDRE